MTSSGIARAQQVRRDYYERNRQACIDRANAWAEKNKERRREIGLKWSRENKDKRKIAQQNYRKENPVKYLIALAKRRAERRGIEFSIGPDDLSVPDICPLLEIPIDSYSKKPDFRPSIDRIDNSKGYVKGNVMIVSQRANRIKSDCCGEEMLLMAINLLDVESAR